ncbi:HK97 gp10 family phage protein [Thalassospira sp. MCCC 1A01428]|uniref:HK97 gp10 family phage protein n=1 Tax=Thalassospira sp. MCCC 1A01428 TaxID=1470575 RepID=UPI000A1F371E|nr:HK97 gp10 family phage protein [Thalassospira sp. MCCC 1A01428]OSQ34363.1 hypothetical protein THS27_25495 [Thalassospira sp. MCCC 1A01428]
MTVTGGKQLAARLNALPDKMHDQVVEAVAKAALAVLDEMRRLTPRDSANPGKHAADGLTVVYSENGLKAFIGLPSDALASDYFWFRFLDGGTKGGTVQYRKAGKLGKRYSMTVPARPALHIRDRAVDGADVQQMISLAVRKALNEA